MASREVERVARRLDDAVARARTRVTLEVHAELVATTPVDTGMARASWIPSIGEPATSTAGPDGSPSSASADAGAAAVASERSPDVRSFVTNNVSYIGRLNAGSSKQAPAAFVQAGIRRAIARVARDARGMGVRVRGGR